MFFQWNLAHKNKVFLIDLKKKQHKKSWRIKIDNNHYKLFSKRKKRRWLSFIIIQLFFIADNWFCQNIYCHTSKSLLLCFSQGVHKFSDFMTMVFGTPQKKRSHSQIEDCFDEDSWMTVIYMQNRLLCIWSQTLQT